MDFQATEEQRMAQETARKLAEKELAPRASEMDEHGEIPPDVVKKLAESNLLGLVLPPPFGGMGLDTVAFAAAVEEVSAAYASAGLFLTAHSMASFAVLAFGGDAIKGKHLKDLATGAKIGALAVAEANAGADTLGMETFAEKQGDGYKINGTKLFISNAGIADVYAVLVKTERSRSPQALSLLVVEKGTPGFSFGKREEKLGLRGDSVGELVFSDCLVPAGNLLGPEGAGLGPTLAAGGLGAIGVAAIAVGIARACLDASVKYATQRKAFGNPIGSFEAVQLMISDMKLDVEAARLLVQRAARGRDEGSKDPVNIWTARLFATDAANRVADLAHRVHGCYGYSCEYPIERYSRDARGLSFVFGTQEMLKIFMAKSLIGLPLFA